MDLQEWLEFVDQDDTPISEIVRHGLRVWLREHAPSVQVKVVHQSHRDGTEILMAYRLSAPSTGEGLTTYGDIRALLASLNPLPETTRPSG